MAEIRQEVANAEALGETDLPDQGTGVGWWVRMGREQNTRAQYYNESYGFDGGIKANPRRASLSSTSLQPP